MILFTCFEENISAPTTTSMFTNFENEDDCVLTVVMLQKIKRKDVHVCLLVIGPRLTYLLVSHIHIYIYIYARNSCGYRENQAPKFGLSIVV